MIIRFLTLILIAASLPQLFAEIKPESVVIVYNTNSAESKELAEYYATARNIPAENLVGLKTSKKADISRGEYIKTIQDPLRKIFTARNWWVLTRASDGMTLPRSSKISTIVCMYGVPYQIKRLNPPAPKPVEGEKPVKIPKVMNEASVDSELVGLGIHDLPIKDPINNAYFKKDTSFSDAGLPQLLLVGRIDSPSIAICKRMIDDAIATEKQGLWGMCYLDFSLKGAGYKQGDDWLEKIAKLNYEKGIPTVIDRNKQTFTTNYPMDDAAIYFGWYATHQNGSLLNPEFKFRRGAIATHLHSFSARHIRNPDKHWSGPILAHGAAATLGNVYEPFLAVTTHFDIFYDRLIKGYTFIEAAYMATPAISWQNVMLGDPLYRPFKHINGGGKKTAEDKNYRAISIANSIWHDEPKRLTEKLKAAADAKRNGKIYEYLGLRARSDKDYETAISYFNTSADTLLGETDRLRQWLYIADTYREMGNKTKAIATLKHAQVITADIPELLTAKALLNILDPPAPAPVKNAVKKK